MSLSLLCVLVLDVRRSALYFGYMSVKIFHVTHDEHPHLFVRRTDAALGCHKFCEFSILSYLDSILIFLGVSTIVP